MALESWNAGTSASLETMYAIYGHHPFLHLFYMTKVLFVLLSLAFISCKDTSHKGDNIEILKGDTPYIESIIHQVSQQTLLYLDTIIDTDTRRLVRFHTKLDTSTYQTLQNWIFHNEKKISFPDGSPASRQPDQENTTPGPVG